MNNTPIPKDAFQLFCPNWDCPARGKTGAGNLVSHGKKQERYNQLDDEEGKERTEEKIRDLQGITGPHLRSMIAQERFPVLSTGSFWTNLPHILLDNSFTHPNIQFEKLTPNALRTPKSVIC